MYKIREAQAADYSAITQLYKSKENMHLKEKDSIIEEHFYNESLAESSTKWFVVEKSGEILAFTFFTIDMENKGIEMKKCTIHSEYKKKGLNEHLYKKMEHIANLSGMTYMQADISLDNVDVIDFFERKGWKKENNIHVKYMK